MAAMARPLVHTFDDPRALARAVAARVLDLSAEALAAREVFHLALAGGGTPRQAYAEIADRLDWSRVHLWFGDERHVPPDHAESNYRMVLETLLGRVPDPGPTVHRMPAERAALRLAAAEYAAELARTLPAGEDGVPRLDLVILGMGADGHTASLFPGTCILRDHRWAAAVYVPRLKAWRMSLTLPVINAARHVLFLVSGADKAQAVRQALEDPPTPTPLPAARIRPAGTLEWYLDAEAASEAATRGAAGEAGNG